MNFTIIKTAACKAGFAIQKHLPQILTVIGGVSIGTGTVLACRATLKAEGILIEAKDRLDSIKMATEDKVYDGREEERTKELIKVYRDAAVGFAKLYALPATCIIGGMSCMVTGNAMLLRRNAAVLGAYKALDEAYKGYRGRVAEELGSKKDREFAHGTKSKLYSTKIVEDKDGKKHRETTYTETIEDKKTVSGYARVFDKEAYEWESSPDYNMTFLTVNQQYFNDLLRVRGHVFLNEVYQALGFKDTKAGAVVGWIYSKGHPSHVDFRITDIDYNTYLLDFNVDGVIYDKI